MPRTYNGSTLGAPTPAHTLTPGAEAARKAVRRHATDRAAGKLVTRHTEPKVQPGPVPANAAALVAAAQRAGFDPVALVHGVATVNAGKSNEARHPAVQVAGKHPKRGVGFRATWVNGKAGLGIWYPGGPRVEHPGVAEVAARVKALG